MVESPENKQNKPQDNVLTPEEKPSPVAGIAIGVVLLAISLFVAAIYFGLLNP